MKKNKPHRAKKAKKINRPRKDGLRVILPKTVILEAGNIGDIQRQINDVEVHGYELSSLERHHTEFFQNYVAILSRKKVAIRTIKEGRFL